MEVLKIMEAIKEIIIIASFVVGLITTATGFLIPLVKNRKAKKALEALNSIAGQIQPLVVEAERFVNYTGAEKKQFVLTKINDFAIKNKIPFDETATSNLIEEIVATTKQVNMRDKDKTVEAPKNGVAINT